MHHLIDTITTVTSVFPTGDNPVGEVKLDFGIFGPLFSTTWKKVFAAVWTLAVIKSLFNLLVAFAHRTSAKSSKNPTLMADANTEVQSAIGWTLALLFFTIIIGAVFYIV